MYKESEWISRVNDVKIDDALNLISAPIRIFFGNVLGACLLLGEVSLKSTGDILTYQKGIVDAWTEDWI